MLKKILFIILFIGAVTFNANAQESEIKPEEIINTFFEGLKEKKPQEAVKYIFSNNPWMENKTEQLKTTMQDLENYVVQMGDFYGNEQISKASAGKNLVSFSYLAKYSRQPLRFVFAFYRPKDKWQIHYFKYDDELTDELLEALSAYRLSENIDLGGY